MKHTQTEFEVDVIHLSHPYLVTFSEKATNIYEIESSELKHITSLSEPVTNYLSVFIDPSRDALIIVGEKINIFNLHDGQLQDTFGLFGTMTVPSIYDRGRALVTLRTETVQDGEELEEYKILSYNLFDMEPKGYACLTQIRVASTERYMVYRHVFSSEESGVVVSQHTARPEQPLILHYWSPDGQPYFECLPPIYTVEIPMTLYEAEDFIVRYATSIDKDRFALATLETVPEHLDGEGTYQAVIRTHQLPTLETLWESQPIAGQTKLLYHLPSYGIILAIGQVAEGVSTHEYDYATWILALDVENGERKQFAKLNHRKLGKDLVACDITTVVAKDGQIIASENPSIVFVSICGYIAMLPFSKFLDEGLPSDTSDVLQEMFHSTDLELEDIRRMDWEMEPLSTKVGVGEGSVAVLDDEGFLSVITLET